ncbi:MAG: hypothetical protein PHG96_04745, partial [Kiritimatiellae bacterium]|nr:hypothetical protein [Kiritimatiellia bacterium]
YLTGDAPIHMLGAYYVGRCEKSQPRKNHGCDFISLNRTQSLWVNLNRAASGTLLFLGFCPGCVIV